MKSLRHYNIWKKDFGFARSNDIEYVLNPLRAINPGKTIHVKRLIEIIPDFWDYFLDEVEHKCGDGSYVLLDDWIDLILIWVDKIPTKKLILHAYKIMNWRPDHATPPKATTNTWRKRML